MPPKEDEKTEGDETNRAPYTPSEVKGVRILYVVSAVLWLIVCNTMGIFSLPDPLGLYKFLILLPLAMFAVAAFNATAISRNVENVIIKFNYLSVGLAIVSFLFSKHVGHSHGPFLKIMIFAFFATIASMYDLWLPEKYMVLFKHGKSVLQTFSLTLVLMGLYSYYLSHAE